VRRSLILPALALAALASSASALPADKETSHVVREGETLNGIANRAKVSRDLIIEANDLQPPYIVRIGERLKIPRGEEAEKLAKQSEEQAAPGPAAAPPASVEPEIYTVQAGETLGGVANRTGVPRVLIAEANDLEPPYTLFIGQKLIIPRTREHVVAAGETGFGIAYRYAVSWKDIAIANGIDPDAPIQAGRKLLIPTVLNRPEPAPAPAPEPPPAPAPAATPPPAPAPPSPPARETAQPAKKRVESRFIWPVKGEVRRGFRARSEANYHDGLDIVAPMGATVRATAAGTVIFSGAEPKQFGNLVIIDHGDGWYSAYGSLGRMTVLKGYKIAQGERLGEVGDTSITRQTELHFEIRKDNGVIDPLSLLPRQK